MELTTTSVQGVLRIGSRVALVVALAVVTWSSLAPPEQLPSSVTLSDKLVHWVAYAVLGGVAALAQRRPKVFLTIALLTAFGLLMEILQAQTTYRAFEWPDLWADALGAAFGVLLVTVLLRLTDRPAGA